MARKCASVRVGAGGGCCRAVAGWVAGLRVAAAGCVRWVRAARDAGHVWDASPLDSLALGLVT